MSCADALHSLALVAPHAGHPAFASAASGPRAPAAAAADWQATAAWQPGLLAANAQLALSGGSSRGAVDPEFGPALEPAEPEAWPEAQVVREPTSQRGLGSSLSHRDPSTTFGSRMAARPPFSPLTNSSSRLGQQRAAAAGAAAHGSSAGGAWGKQPWVPPQQLQQEQQWQHHQQEQQQWQQQQPPVGAPWAGAATEHMPRGNGCWVWLPDVGAQEGAPLNAAAAAGDHAPPSWQRSKVPGGGRATEQMASSSAQPASTGAFADSLLDVLSEVERLEAALQAGVSMAGASMAAAAPRASSRRSGSARRQLYAHEGGSGGRSAAQPPLPWMLRQRQAAEFGATDAAWVPPPATALDEDDVVSLILNGGEL